MRIAFSSASFQFNTSQYVPFPGSVRSLTSLQMMIAKSVTCERVWHDCSTLFFGSFSGRTVVNGSSMSTASDTPSCYKKGRDDGNSEPIGRLEGHAGMPCSAGLAMDNQYLSSRHSFSLCICLFRSRKTNNPDLS